MLDNLSILVTSIALLYLIWRAGRLDRVMPFFGTQAAEKTEQRRRPKHAWRREDM